MEARRPWWDEGRDPTRNVRRVVLEEPPAKLLKQGGSKRGSASRQKNQEERAGVFQRAMQRADEAEQALAKARRENNALRNEIDELRRLNDDWREKRYKWRQELRELRNDNEELRKDNKTLNARFAKLKVSASSSSSSSSDESPRAE